MPDQKLKESQQINIMEKHVKKRSAVLGVPFCDFPSARNYSSRPRYPAAWIISLLFLLLCGCQADGQSPPVISSTPSFSLYTTTPSSVPNLIPTTTWTYQPAVTATHTLLPEQLPLLTPTPELPLATSTLELTSLLVLDPVQIFTPGPGSQVVAPISLEGQLMLPQTAWLLRIELYSLDGTLLSRKVYDWEAIKRNDGVFSDQLDFEISTLAEDGWLIWRVEDQLRTPLAINSVLLTLISEGAPLVTRQAWQAKMIDIQQPAGIGAYEGGELTVSGLTRLAAEKPLKIQLVGPDGRVVGQRLAKIEPQVGEFLPFTAQVPYQVQEETQVTLIVYQDDGPAGIITHLASLPVILRP